MRNSDDHILFGDKILDIKFFRRIDDFRSTLIAKPINHLIELFFDDLHLPIAIVEDVAQIRNCFLQPVELAVDFVALQTSETLQGHTQNSLCLHLAENEPFFTANT